MLILILIPIPIRNFFCYFTENRFHHREIPSDLKKSLNTWIHYRSFPGKFTRYFRALSENIFLGVCFCWISEMKTFNIREKGGTLQKVFYASFPLQSFPGKYLYDARLRMFFWMFSKILFQLFQNILMKRSMKEFGRVLRR